MGARIKVDVIRIKNVPLENCSISNYNEKKIRERDNYKRSTAPVPFVTPYVKRRKKGGNPLRVPTTGVAIVLMTSMWNT